MQHEGGRPPKQEVGSEPDWPSKEGFFVPLVLELLVEVRGRDEPLARTLVTGRWACPDSWFSVLLPLCWSKEY